MMIDNEIIHLNKDQLARIGVELLEIKISLRCMRCGHQWGMKLADQKSIYDLNIEKKGWNLCLNCLLKKS